MAFLFQLALVPIREDESIRLQSDHPNQIMIYASRATESPIIRHGSIMTQFY
jgi:hypothetical protein